MCAENSEPKFVCAHTHTHSKKEHEGRKKRKTIEGMLEWDPQMLAYIPPFTTRTYLWYRFQWSICSFSLSLSTWHHPPKEELWFPFFISIFFPHVWMIFLFEFSHQKPQRKKRKKKRNSSEFFLLLFNEKRSSSSKMDFGRFVRDRDDKTEEISRFRETK